MAIFRRGLPNGVQVQAAGGYEKIEIFLELIQGHSYYAMGVENCTQALK